MLSSQNNHLKSYLLAEKAFKLIQNERMKMINKQDLKLALTLELKQEHFNLYAFVKSFLQQLKQ
jgi:LAO/AO transport system kinase